MAAFPHSQPLRIIAFGAHPDDCELRAAGVASQWTAAGHHVKFVSLTNGDVGHFAMHGAPLARRRKAEVETCARILGIQTEVLDIPDGTLLPSLENRETVARLIRSWQADIVLFHRPNDYHPDHRYAGVLVQDAAVLVAAPFYVPDTPPVARNPVLLYYYDGFRKPCPFEPSVVVGIDAVAEKKWACIAAMPSQFADPDSWLGRYLPGVPQDEAGRKEYLLEFFRQQDRDIADRYRDRLIAAYGERGRGIRFAEAFELCEYGSQPPPGELQAMIPGLA
jgi:LmbE family N-acetylglucosaminyl deacetylase